jgi:hypothetical protein
VLLCFLMAVIGVLAEWSRAPQASRPGGASPVLGRNHTRKRRQRVIQLRVGDLNCRA